MISGNDVAVTPSMLVAATGRKAGLWNDAQSFHLDHSGHFEVTWCGVDSLCSHLGLAEGDLISADPIEIGRIIFGGVADVTVDHEHGTSEVWTLSLM
jgi:hypothetical protein